MLNYFKDFFYPDIRVYRYKLSKEEVTITLNNVFQQKISLFDSFDIQGEFINSYQFSLNIISTANTKGGNYTSKLLCEILETQNGFIKIKTTAKRNVIYYFTSFISVVFGFVYLYDCIRSDSEKLLVLSIAVIIFGMALSIGFSNVAIKGIRERYEMYIDKILHRQETNYAD